MIKIQKSDLPNIKELYETGSTLKAIADHYSVSRECIANNLRIQGIVLQNGSSRRASKGVDLDFFNRESEEAAYYFGLLLSDGNISDRGKVTIGLQSKDRAILESLVSAAKLNSHVKDVSRSNTDFESVQLCFTVKSLSASLSLLGLTPRKSLKEKAPDRFLFNRHFWRGMVDGDGSIASPNKARVYLCGGKEICEQFLAYCKVINPTIDTQPALSAGGVWRTSITGSKAASILSELYCESNFKLERKFERAKAILLKYYGDSCDI